MIPRPLRFASIHAASERWSLCLIFAYYRVSAPGFGVPWRTIHPPRWMSFVLSCNEECKQSVDQWRALTPVSQNRKRKSSFGFRPWYGVKARDPKGRYVALIYTSRRSPARMALQPQRYHPERRKLYQQVRPCALRTGSPITSAKLRG